MFSKTILLPVVAVLAAALLFLGPAIYNGFPFVFPNSGDYLVLHPLIHRTPFYGLLITFFHLNRFIWPPVVMQSILLAHVIYLFVRCEWPELTAPRFVMLSGVLVVLTSLPWFSGWIMADVFTPIMFLAMYMLAFHGASLSRALYIYLLLVAVVSTSVHLTNVSLATGLLPLFAIIKLSIDRNTQSIRRLTTLCLPVAAAIGAVFAFNVVIFHTTKLSAAGQSFFMANLIEYGPGRDYLKEACPDAGYKLCDYLDQLPATADGLLWQSHIYDRLGSFPAMEPEARAIVRATIHTRPWEVAEMIGRNFLATFSVHAPAGEFYAEQQIREFADLIELKFGKATLAAYLASREMNNTLPHGLLQAIDDVVFPSSFLALVLITATALLRKRHDLSPLAISTLVFVLADFLLCSAVSGVHDRYQARVTWLFPLVVIVLLPRLYREFDRCRLSQARTGSS